MDYDLHAEKTREGMLKAVQAGKHVGRPPKWAVRDSNGNLKIRDDMKAFIEAYLPYAVSLANKRDMKILLNHMLPKTSENITIEDLRRIRRSSFYYGYVSFNGQYYDTKTEQEELQMFWEMRLASQELKSTRFDISKSKGQSTLIWEKAQRKKERTKRFLSNLNKI